jgi:hypothetical protein
VFSKLNVHKNKYRKKLICKYPEYLVPTKPAYIKFLQSGGPHSLCMMESIHNKTVLMEEKLEDIQAR